MSLIDFPEISEFDPKYETFLNSVSYCEGRLWVCGDNRMVKSFNLNNLEEKKYKTISRYGPSDIAVKRNGHLVYTDISTKSINTIGHYAAKRQGNDKSKQLGTNQCM